MALKNTDVGVGVINLDYREDIKVVIMNHSPKYHLHIGPRDHIAQFIMTRYKTPKLLEVIEADATRRGSGGFSSPGK